MFCGTVRTGSSTSGARGFADRILRRTETTCPADSYAGNLTPMTPEERFRRIDRLALDAIDSPAGHAVPWPVARASPCPPAPSHPPCPPSSLPLLAAATTALLLTACAQPWSRPPGKSESDFASDTAQCRQSAAGLYPKIGDQKGSGQPLMACHSSGGFVQCAATQGFGPAGAQMDANAIARGNSVESCLRALGYRR